MLRRRECFFMSAAVEIPRWTRPRQKAESVSREDVKSEIGGKSVFELSAPDF